MSLPMTLQLHFSQEKQNERRTELDHLTSTDAFNQTQSLKTVATPMKTIEDNHCYLWY